MPVIKQARSSAGPIGAPPPIPKISGTGFRVEQKASYQGEVKVPEILLMGKARRIQSASVGRQMRAELSKYKLRPGALDDLGDEDDEEHDLRRAASPDQSQAFGSPGGSRAASPMSLRGKNMMAASYEQQPYGGTREMRSLQRQILETEEAAHESRLETERILARTQETRKKVEEKVGKVKDNNTQLDSELTEIERQIEELKKISRTQMEEIRALRESNKQKDTSLRDEQKVLESMEMSVKDAMAAAREEKLRRQEEAERAAKAAAKLKEEEEAKKKAQADNSKSYGNARGGDEDEGFYEGDKGETVPSHPDMDSLIAASHIKHGISEAEEAKPSEDIAEVAPWLAGMRAPSDWTPAKGSSMLGFTAQPTTPPDAQMTPDHVFGFRGIDCKDLLVETGRDKVVWGAGSAAVVLDVASGKQRLFTAHGAPLSAMALHPDGLTIATGEVGKEARVLVWDSETLSCTAGLWGTHQGGVACLCFSRDGTRIASVGIDLEHSICVWDWRRQVPLAVAKAGPQPVFSVRFSPDDSQLVSVGTKHVKFWQTAPGSLQAAKANFANKGSLQGFLCCEFLPLDGVENGKSKFLTLAGAQDGCIYVFTGSTLTYVQRRAHEGGPIMVMISGHSADGTPFVISGGADGRVRRWEANAAANLKPQVCIVCVCVYTCMNVCTVGVLPT
jgi:hypothetical protein